MNIITRQLRALLLAAAMVGAFVWTASAQTAGTFTDTRDGKTYKTAKMPGGKTWFAENLNYQTGSSLCYGGNNANCAKYGRLYDIETAKKACPAGWHLSSGEEWGNMLKAMGSKRECNDDCDECEFYSCSWNGAPEKKLKAKSGWKSNGTDAYGFSALPGGTVYIDNSNFQDIGKASFWLSLPGEGYGFDGYSINEYGIGNQSEGGGGERPSSGYVRCVQN